MTEPQALASHGTLVAVELSGASTGVFTTIGNLGGDITPPELLRPMTETSPHNDDIDTYTPGIGRRGELQFGINFRPSGDGTHDHLTGVQKLWADSTFGGWRLTYTDGLLWIFSGYVARVGPSAPVREGALTAQVTVRPSGQMKIGSVLFG